MAERVTIMLDEDVSKKLHTIQADQIRKTGKTYSFSKALNETVRKALK